MRRFYTFQSQKKIENLGLSLGFGAKACSVVEGNELFLDFTVYCGRIAMKEAFMPPFLFLCPHFSLISLPLLKHNDRQMLFTPKFSNEPNMQTHLYANQLYKNALYYLKTL